MRKLIVSEFVSLDGVMQAPGGADEDTEGGFSYGGWSVPYWHDDIGAAFGALMQDVDAFLLGRKTYVIHANAFEPMQPGHEPVPILVAAYVNRRFLAMFVAVLG